MANFRVKDVLVPKWRSDSSLPSRHLCRDLAREKSGLATAFALVLFCSSAAAQQPPQLRLPDTVAPTSYRVHLKLDPDKDNFSGRMSIKIDVKQPANLIWLNGADISIGEASLKTGGRSMSAKPVPGGADFVGLQFAYQVPAGAAELDIQYTGKVRRHDSSGVFHMAENGNNYLFTQFESTDARGAFPCFDEPSYKVPWQLTLDVPKDDDAVSNTPIVKNTTEGDRKIYTFKETKPLPSYLIAFAIGQFDFVPAGYAGKNHVPVRIVTPKGHAAEAKYAAEVTATILTRLEDYFGIPYPYEKSDQVAIPSTFGFGAMENAGMVTYGQTILLANPERDTVARQRECASVEAHELAHQWVGDLVTTAWWNDIWLNEAFATWMEQKILAEWKPEWHTRVEDVNSKLGAEAEDSLVSARKIRQEIKTKDDISNAFDAITYQKGAAVIGMFENWVGPQEFRKGVHSYLMKYAFRNATAPEFLDAVSSATKKDITQPFSTFLNQAGVPLVSVSLDCRQNAPTLHVEQQRFLPLGSKGSTDQVWQVPVCVRYGSGNTGQSACKLVSQPKVDWALKTKSCPAWVQANDNAVGYYRVDYEKRLLADLTNGDVDRRLPAAERVDFIGNARALAGAGKLAAGDSLGLVEVFHSDPERYVVEGALALALQPRLHLVPEDLKPNYQRFLQKNFGARARELGWIPKPGESDDVRLLRPTLVPDIATYGGDEELAKEGRALAEKWLQDRNSVDPNMVAAVLRTAAYYGDKALFEKFLAQYKESKDRQERQRLLRALAFFRDPSTIRAAEQAVLSGEIPMVQGGGYLLLSAGQSWAETRRMPFDFLKAHYDEILKDRPTGGGSDFGGLLPRVGQSYCSAESRDALKNFFEPKVDKLTGAPRTLSQVLESIDVCIAQKSAEQPSVEALLKKY
jgi:alanyl aminopeptidase